MLSLYSEYGTMIFAIIGMAPSDTVYIYVIRGYDIGNHICVAPL